MSGNINFNGWLNDDGSENYKCRAWVNFNGQGTVAIRASGNVSSITDNGTGDYTVNFATAMQDADYSMTGSAETVNGSGTQVISLGTLRVASGTAYATGSVLVVTNEGPTLRVDVNVVSISIFR